MGLEKLPPGVTLTADTMDPGLNVVPVVFEAKPDAAAGGFLTTITAAHADPKVKVPAKTAFDAVFSVGINNTPYMRHYTDRTAVAVGEPAPYSIEVIEPKVPLVQNGSFNLRVVAKRAEGFKGRDHGVPAVDAAGPRASRARRSSPKGRPSACCR